MRKRFFQPRIIRILIIRMRLIGVLGSRVLENTSNLLVSDNRQENKHSYTLKVKTQSMSTCSTSL